MAKLTTWTLAVLLVWLLGAPLAAEELQQQGAETILLDMAITEATLGRVEPAEAIIAFQLYSEAYVRTLEVQVEVEATVFGDIDQLLASALQGREKVMALQVQDYFHVGDRVGLDLFFVAERSGRVTETFVILVRGDGGIDSLAQLRGLSLQTCRGQQMGLAPLWLECLLADQGLPASGYHFGAVEVQARISGAVLPVLLGQADACLVAQSGLEAMAELNPQILEELRPLASSPPLISFVACIRSDFQGENRALAERAFFEAHTHPRGRQVLALFGFDRVVRCSPADLASAREIVARYEALSLDPPR